MTYMAVIHDDSDMRNVRSAMNDDEPAWAGSRNTLCKYHINNRLEKTVLVGMDVALYWCERHIWEIIPK